VSKDLTLTSYRNKNNPSAWAKHNATARHLTNYLITTATDGLPNVGAGLSQNFCQLHSQHSRIVVNPCLKIAVAQL
jgi:hypothetical protein